MDIIGYINSPLKEVKSIDEAMEVLDSYCIALYKSETPHHDFIILKERFGIDACITENNTIIIPVTKEMVNLNNEDLLLKEISKIGLDKNNFEI